MANEIKKQDNDKTKMQVLIKKMEPEIKKALPSVMTPERFTRIALSALSNTPKLVQCTPQSFLGAMMNAAQLGLEPNTPLGQAYLIPYKRYGVMECQFQIGAKGYVDLAHRSGVNVWAYTVYENDEFSYELGLNPDLKHVPARGDRGKPIYYYAVYRTKDGVSSFEVMSFEDVMKHAKQYSPSFGNGPWQTNFNAMAEKTCIKRVLKYAPLKSEFARAITADETIKTEISEDMYEVQNVIEVEGNVVEADEAPADEPQEQQINLANV